RVAMGQPLRVHAGTLQPRGHAIECRITAEDPFNDFLPATGTVRHLRVPGGPGVRWDAGVEAGNEVTLYYDPLIAKLIVWGETRAVALERMRRALRELTIESTRLNSSHLVISYAVFCLKKKKKHKKIHSNIN